MLPDTICGAVKDEKGIILILGINAFTASHWVTTANQSGPSL
jgi:hypothetical protein